MEAKEKEGNRKFDRKKKKKENHMEKLIEELEKRKQTQRN